ncbi:MAG TPA: transaldolase [Burkholderiaceae bacterium]|nr:transaldolase [Burkholderiaceae bacterium]
MNLLEGLKRHTTIVADTGDLAAIERLRPRDATTNPSLILKAAQQPQYRALVETTLRETPGESIGRQLDHLLVAFGTRILALIRGRVSTEVDARLSFDTRASVERARRLIDLYDRRGVAPERVLIKIAGTWEGLRAAEALEREGIHCNITLLFCMAQAIAAAQAGATLISPFVGRIYDWHRKAAGAQWDEAAMSGANDPGVRSVKAIHARLKGAGYSTEIMGASFRNTGQILALAGCDLLTISPELLDQLASTEGPIDRALSATDGDAVEPPLVEGAFRYALNDDAMAVEKLAEGIRVFAADADRLESMLRAMS